MQPHDGPGGPVGLILTAHKSTGTGKPRLAYFGKGWHCGYIHDNPMWWAGPLPTPAEAYALWKRAQPTGRAP